MPVKLRSSHIDSVDFNNGNLTVTFKKGGTYIYHGVSPTTYLDLLRTASPGSFLNRRIKPHFKFTKKASG